VTLTPLKTLTICLGALSVSACSTHSIGGAISQTLGNLFTDQTPTACAGSGAAYSPACAHIDHNSRYAGYSQNGYVQNGYSGGYYQQGYAQPAYVQQGLAYAPYPALRTYVPPPVTYVQSPHSVISYVPIAAPEPAPIYEPAPIISEPIIIEPETAPPPLSSWVEPWEPEPSCPPGTIPGYNGADCVQVDVIRK